MLNLNNDMRNRKDILEDLVFFKGDFSELENELSEYTWDVIEPILIIRKIDFFTVFKSCIEDKITLKELEKWANAIECRDDLSFEDEEMQEIIFELANPEINGEITKERLQEIINELLM